MLAPIAGWLVWKSNQDSAVFNTEGYQRFFRRLLGLRLKRNINRKEVILNEVNVQRVVPALQQLCDESAAYVKTRHLYRMPNYFRVFFRYEPDTVVIGLEEQLEKLVEELSNSRDTRIIATLNEMPILVPDAHTRPFRNPRLNVLMGVFFPVGLVLWLRIWRYRLRLWRDLEQLQKHSLYIVKRLKR